MIWNPSSEESEFLAEIAYLYDAVVKTGTREPIIDVGMKLMIPVEKVSEAVSTSMAWGFIAGPKRGTWGGEITNKAHKYLVSQLSDQCPNTQVRSWGEYHYVQKVTSCKDGARAPRDHQRCSPHPRERRTNP